jgi:hypothetical protein
MMPAGATNAPINYVGLNVGSSQWNMPIPIGWGRWRASTNAFAFYDFTAKPANGKGKGLGGKDQQQTYFANCILGLCEGPLNATAGITNIWASGSTTTVTTLADLGMVPFLGTETQAPWSLIVTKHPTLARAYAYTAYLGAPGLALGESATIPDNAFELQRYDMFVAAGSFVLINATGGWINPNTHEQSPSADCLMSDIVTDFLTNVQYGMGFTAADLGPIAQYATYLQAQGLFYSPWLVEQEKATEIIDRWAQLSNSWIYWSGTQLQFVPLGDSVVTGNGVTYTPVQDVADVVAFEDLIYDAASNGDDDSPIKVTRKDPADAHNRTCLNFCDRTLGYIDNPVQWKDDGSIRFGLRDDSTTEANEIKLPAVAATVVQLLGKRNAYLLNDYSFKVHARRGILWLPGSILELNEPNLGLVNFPVRVKTIDRDEKRELSVVCEWFPGNVGTYYPPLVTQQTAPATTPVTNIAPGNVNTPAIVEPNSAYTGGVPKIIIAASGGANAGTIAVFLSFDGLEYGQVGTITSPAKQGVLTAALAAYGGANPDTTHTLAVDCTESQTVPAPVTNADAAALRTLSLVAAQPTVSGGVSVIPTNGELLAFGAVAATGTYAANLTYLERAAYGATAGAHSIGDQFTLIDVSGADGSSIAYELPPQYIGQTIYLKFCAQNVFGQAQQDISTVVEYQYTTTGAGFGSGAGGVPAEPTGLAVGTPAAGMIPLAWNPNPATDNVTTYTLLRAPGAGASFSAAAAIWTGDATGYTDATVAAATSYTYFLVANNAAGSSVHTAGVNATTTAAARGGYSTSVTGAVAAPTSTSTYTMMGLGGSVTPNMTGVVQITLSGLLEDTGSGATTAAGTGIEFFVRYGTGTAPTNGAAAAGTNASIAFIWQLPGAAAATADVYQPFSCTGIITGLTPGTPYWIDVAARALGVANAIAIASSDICAVELH